MDFQVGDFVIFTGSPGGPVTEWLKQTGSVGVIINIGYSAFINNIQTAQCLWANLDVSKIISKHKPSGLWSVDCRNLSLFTNPDDADDSQPELELDLSQLF